MSDFTYQRESATQGEIGGLFGSTPVAPSKRPEMGTKAPQSPYLPDAAQFARDERDTGGTKRLPAPTTAQEFAAFHAENPHVYVLLVRLARDAKRSGIQRTAKGLLEDLRSMAGLQTDGKPFKLNNDFTPYYARLIMAQEPELQGYFRLRFSRGDG